METGTSDAPGSGRIARAGSGAGATRDANPLTTLLTSWSAGDDEAGQELIGRIYPELRDVASRLLRRDSNLSLQLTELVSETYLRLDKVRHYTWKNRGQFLAVAATLIRQILVDFARRKNSSKRGGGAPAAVLHDQMPFSQTRSASEILALHQALEVLAADDPLAARLVEMRYFCGLSIDEAAGALEIGRTKAVKTWTYARARLRWELTRDTGNLR